MTKTLTSFTNSRGDTFALHEWVIAEYALHQIVEIRDFKWGISVDRSTGYILCGGRADDCWKLTLTTKLVAEGVESYRKLLKELPGEHGFNWPDLHHKLVEFAEVGYALDREWPRKADDWDDIQARNLEFKHRLWDPLDAWFEEVKAIATSTARQTAGGVRVIGR